MNYSDPSMIENETLGQTVEPHIGDFIAVIPDGERVWAVPSIHGELALLEERHRELVRRFQPGRDRLIYLGNFMGHGPHVGETVSELLRFRRELMSRPGVEPDDIIYLRGAQEEMWWKLLKLQIATEPSKVLEWMLEHGVEATLTSYGGTVKEARSRCREGTMGLTRWTSGLRRTIQAHPGHFELLTGLSRAAVTASRTLLFVHASVDPSRPLGMQHDMFWWDTGTFNAISQPFEGFKLVIRGYDHLRQGPDLDQPYRATVDAGAGFGGDLLVVAVSSDGKIIDKI